jgi:hypothetical protein
MAAKKRKATNGEGRRALQGSEYLKEFYDKFGHMAERLEKHITKLKRFGLPDPSVVEYAETARDNLHQAVETMNEIPSDWKPVRGSISSQAFGIGDRVMLRDTAAEKYTGFLEADEKMEITRLLGTRVVCSIKSRKIETTLPRTHVQRAD